MDTVRGHPTDSGALVPRHRGLTTALVVLLVVASVAGWWYTTRSEASARTARADAVAAPTAAAVVGRLTTVANSLLSVVGEIGGTVDVDPQQFGQLLDAASPGNDGAIALAVRDATGAVVVRPIGQRGTLVLPAGTNLAATPAWRAALNLARDDGRPRTAVGTGPPGAAQVLMAAPLYGAALVPVTVDERRARIQGYVVAVESAGGLFGDVLGGGASRVGVELLDGTRVVVSSEHGVRAPMPKDEAPVTVSTLNWRIYAWPTGGRSPLPWIVLAVGLMLALATAATLLQLARMAERLANDALARADEMRFVARVGPSLQRSLELSDLIPAFVVEISDELDLDRVAISHLSAQGELVEIFSAGPRTEAAPDALLRPAVSEVEPGGDVVVPLQRGGRVVGAITARARSGLDPPRLAVLRTLGDLLSSALGNAALLQQEQEMVHRFRDLDRMKTTFLGSVSHELRTMVTAIAGFANLLAADAAGPTGRQGEYVERISRNANSLGVLIDDLLDFARLERSGLSVAPRPVDLSDLVPRVVDQMSSLLTGRDVSVDIEANVIAPADPGAIERILANLLSNAAKYSPPGTPVRVGVRSHDGMAVLTVADSGPGIPADERTQVFGLFYRGDGPSVHAARGVGIGLALVAELTTLMGGTATASEAPGGGALFTISLPMAPDGGLAADEAGPGPAGPGTAVLPEPGPRRAGPGTAVLADPARAGADRRGSLSDMQPVRSP